MIDQIEHDHLLVQVAWIGPKLTVDFIMNYRGSKPIMYMSWWPSPLGDLDNFMPLSFPACYSRKQNTSESYLCKYELHSIHKYVSRQLKKVAPLVTNVSIYCQFEN